METAVAAALGVIDRIHGARDRGALVELLHDAKASLGADDAVFVTFVRDDPTMNSYRFLVACDPLGALAHVEEASIAGCPWLRYARQNTQPACAPAIAAPVASSHPSASRAAERHGMASAYIVPVPASTGLSRIGVLVLGSRQPGHFEQLATPRLTVLAQGLAMEMHRWWVRQIGHELQRDSRLTSEDLFLLRLEHDGLGTKSICELLKASPASVNSRFQRLNRKMNARNRQAAARLAAEYQLI